jgi:hypothetical protein
MPGPATVPAPASAEVQIKPGTVVHIENDGAGISLFRNAFTRRGVPYIWEGLGMDALDEYAFHKNVAGLIVDLALGNEPKLQRLRASPSEPTGATLIRLVRERGHHRLPILVLTTFRAERALVGLIARGMVQASDVYRKGLDAEKFAEETYRRFKNAGPNLPAVEPVESGFRHRSQEMELLQFGKYDYHFVRHVTSEELAHLLPDVRRDDGGVPDDKQVAYGFHKLFQGLYRKPFHEMSPKESHTWQTVKRMVDFDRFRREFPEPETRVGHVIENSIDVFAVEWKSQQQDRFNVADIPGRLLAAKAGDALVATFRRSKDRSEWIAWTLKTAASAESEPSKDLTHVPDLETAPIDDAWPKAER